MTQSSVPIVRHFRQILMWPLQLMPLRDGEQVQRHWEYLSQCGRPNPWREVEDEFTPDPAEFQERHYREFVTFLPHVQRFLYGQGRNRLDQDGVGDSPIRVFRRTDVQGARLRYDDGTQVDFAVKHVDLYFFYDMDVVILVIETHANDLPLDRVQDTLYRFGRAFPAGWEPDGSASHCMRGVQWLDGAGAVLAQSDFEDRQKFLSFAGEHRSARVGAHWEYLLEPMVSHHSADPGPLRYRQLEYLRMPKMSFLALDDPFALSRDDFVRLALGTSPDDGDGLRYSAQAVDSFERDFFFDRFWAPDRRDPRASTRVACNGHSMVMVGSARVPWFVDAETGMLGQFRHQYFLVGLIAHFHKAALLLLSDRLVTAVTRLDVENAESLYRFKSQIRQSLEVFLRFNHRYWFHEVSNQAMARRLYEMFAQHLGNEALFNEVREEVLDMGQYLDSDDSRRQGEAVLRLTVVTIFGLIGTIVTGFLGMNLLAEAEQPLPVKIAMFIAVLVPTVVLTMLTVNRSNALSEMLDAIGNSRLSRGERLATLGKVLGWRRRR
ncbi:MAG: hypothetical protein KAY46_09220 [Burkholderiaceae bacterium]|nr:hypothetical protein [Burkholderiaceae bacterium]